MWVASFVVREFDCDGAAGEHDQGECCLWGTSETGSR